MFLDRFTKEGKNRECESESTKNSKLLCFIKTILAIVIGCFIYAIALHFFIFPHGILLGGTGGVSVLLNRYLPGLSPDAYLVIINTLLMLLALVVLGKKLAGKTMLGSFLTTVFVGILDSDTFGNPMLISNEFFSAVIGAVAVAVGSVILFCVDSSSGGTDIVALIIKKYSCVSIGKALLISDVLIVLVGVITVGWTVAIASVAGFLIKVFGIDLLIRWRHIFDTIEQKKRMDGKKRFLI